MRFWLRQATLQLGSSRYALDDLRFSFKVAVEDRPKVGSCEIEVINLSPDTRAAMQKGDPVLLCAGYKDDVGTIFIGNITEFSHALGSVDVVTKIKAMDAIEAWLGQSVNKTYRQGTGAKEIVDDLLTMFGIESGVNQLANPVIYPRGKVCTGKVKDVLTEIAVRDCGSRLLIRTNQIIINPPAEGLEMGLLLTPETGLLKAGATGEGQSPNSSAKPVEKSREEQVEAEGTIKRECLLNYRIGCADIVMVRDSQIDGQYRVVRLTHEGSVAGKWITSLELIPA